MNKQKKNIEEILSALDQSGSVSPLMLKKIPFIYLKIACIV